MSWIECQDGGDPAVSASPRDIVYVLGGWCGGGAGSSGSVFRRRLVISAFPPSGTVFLLRPSPTRCLMFPPPRTDADAAADAAVQPRAIAGTDMRCRGVSWGTGSFALLYEAEWKSRRSVTWVSGRPGAGGQQAPCAGVSAAGGQDTGRLCQGGPGSEARGGREESPSCLEAARRHMRVAGLLLRPVPQQLPPPRPCLPPGHCPRRCRQQQDPAVRPKLRGCLLCEASCWACARARLCLCMGCGCLVPARPPPALTSSTHTHTHTHVTPPLAPPPI